MTAHDDPERALALSYARPADRAALASLLDLDATLALILRRTGDPLVGQMRLTWWHDALTALDTAPPPAQPVLQALAVYVLPHGVPGIRLAEMIEGWEALLDLDAIDGDRLDTYAAQRGAALFRLAGEVLSTDGIDPLEMAGAGWALADLAAHSRNPNEAALASAGARASLRIAMTPGWSRAGRPLGALALIAQMNLAPARSRPGAPSRVARLAWHRMTGR